MKKIVVSILGFVGATVVSNANANFEDWADVVDVVPNYRQVVVPYQDCQMVTVPVQVQTGTTQRRAGTDSVLGAVVGGVIGSTVGKGHGRRAATAAGAIIGYQMGKDDVYVPNGGYATEYRQVNQCVTRNRTEVIQDGYIVTYKYLGYTGNMRSATMPGSKINVFIRVDPR